LAICALLAAGCISQLVSQSQAALFDFLRPKRAAATDDRRDPPRGAPSQAAVRQAAYWQQPGSSSAVTQATFFDSGAQTGWGHDSSPCSDSGCNNGCCKGFLHSLFCCGNCDTTSDCFNCGECDHCICTTRHHRRKCNQTWYPRLAPYCEQGWGWTQPCWRRMDDNYNCPRPAVISTKPQPRTYSPPPAPAAETLPTPPEPPSIPSTRRNTPSRPQIASPSPRAPRGEPTLPQNPADAQPTRFTSFAETLESDADVDAEDGEVVEDTLESEMEPAEGELEGEEEADPPAIEDAEM
jgi:hypothetical protein